MRISIFLLLALPSLLWAQMYKVVYQQLFEGKLVENQNSVIILSQPTETLLLNQAIWERKATFPYEISFIDRKDESVSVYGFLGDNQKFSYRDGKIISQYQFEKSDETKTILGYPCKKAVARINSNTIVLWYTDKLKDIKGSPNILGQNLGLVLEVTRNGSHTQRAISVQKIKNVEFAKWVNPSQFEATDALSYRDLLWKSRFTTLSIFKDEQINFTNEKKDETLIRRYGKGTVILKKVSFPEIQSNSLLLAELRQRSNGDAYDRTGSVFFIPENKTLSFFDALEKGIDAVPNFVSSNGQTYKGMVATETYEPAVELMRFFTAFGIKKFNHIELKDKTWHEVSPYRQDISEFGRTLGSKNVWVGVYIGNYDGGGHKVSLDITIHPDGKNLWKTDKVIPLFNTVNLMENAGQGYATLFESPEGLQVEFQLDKPLKNAKLRYITTGHGGWENGDEFVPKVNAIALDGKEVFRFIPWRTDCGSYRLYNPASGNFNNGLSSSDYSRSNWCPGTITPPQYIELGDLSSGKHRLSVRIPQGEKEGGSFSYWSVSGVLMGE